MKISLFRHFCLTLILVAVLPSCSSDFRKAWKKAPVTNDLDGKWEGTWLSEASGHHGKLRCVVANDTCGAGLPPNVLPRSFYYHATWMKILSGSYRNIDIVQDPKDGVYTFKGEYKMPVWAGGLYHYEGTIKGDEFKANYRCSMDRGTYSMKRVR